MHEECHAEVIRAVRDSNVLLSSLVGPPEGARHPLAARSAQDVLAPEVSAVGVEQVHAVAQGLRCPRHPG